MRVSLAICGEALRRRERTLTQYGGFAQMGIIFGEAQVKKLFDELAPRCGPGF